MASDGGHNRLLCIVLEQILSDVGHGSVAVHSWHVEIHQNEVENTLFGFSILALQVLLDHLKGMLTG